MNTWSIIDSFLDVLILAFEVVMLSHLKIFLCDFILNCPGDFTVQPSWGMRGIVWHLSCDVPCQLVTTMNYAKSHPADRLGVEGIWSQQLLQMWSLPGVTTSKGWVLATQNIQTWNNGRKYIQFFETTKSKTRRNKSIFSWQCKMKAASLWHS